MTNALTPITLLEPGEAITIDGRISVEQRFLKATLFATGITGSETVTIKFSADGGETFSTTVAQGGSNVELTVGNNLLTIESPIFLEVTKSAVAIGVFILTNQLAIQP